ncbi:uncharacterized protein JN550_007525 [Neoarthrinium moseri]|uniref:uncharacterized protein n=1 Tax=Neoarthrinium moseri TaxID=1658444 RepID=UPI001FDBF83A|nr:uncharacterized protein JN550_007525 [Neoarthrinium moseri]KAI1866672.1 hypothetical protein JN550_007525 [Neoarthrinium moseri]
MSVTSSTSSESVYLERDDDIAPVARTAIAKRPVSTAKMPKKIKQKTPQDTIDEFWAKFTTKAPGKATTVIPHNSYVDLAAKHAHQTAGITTQASYDEAAAVCQAKVAKIVKECRRVNQKYRDPHFDLEWDLKWGKRDTLETLYNFRNPLQSKFKPKSVKRVPDIFENPRFYIDGPTASDVRQGRDGDCWLLAALCTLSNKPSLIERCCVARDEQVGVYGFVFHRDGEWISEIIDDKLFLTKPDFEESFLERVLWEDRERVESEEQYRKAYQSGSGSLYFAQCVHPDETWVPLLEKAYAKAHGDFAAIEGGFTGEGIEDLTGGVTSELYTSDILDTEYFWKEELMKVNEEFLFGCSTGMWGIGWGERRGILELHAYSVMRAVEVDGHRLLLLQNPWGKGEWKGPWSDGSKEWTAEWLLKLNHRFGDDGSFWISYKDLLRKYQAFDRTRLFGPEWKVTSLWTTLSVPWTLDYHDTQFAFSLTKSGPVVLVLSQLDDRYYRGLEGQYRFELNFRLHKTGQEDYVVRSINPYCQKRSVNVELKLEAGDYTVLLKINATRDMGLLPIEEVVRNYARERRDKLVAVGMSYDLAHSKGKIIESEEERRARKDVEKRKEQKQKEELKKKLMNIRQRNHYYNVKEQNKRRENKAKAKAKVQLRKYQKAEREKAMRGAKDIEDSEATQDPLQTGRRVQILTPGSTPGPGDSQKELPLKTSKPSQDTNATMNSVESEKSTPVAPDPGFDTTPVPQTSDASGVPTEWATKLATAAAAPYSVDSSSSGVVSEPQSSTFKGQTTKALEAQTSHTNQDREDRNTKKAAEPPSPETDSEIHSSSDESDISSVADISDRELEYELQYQLEARARPPPPVAAQPTASDEAEKEEEDDDDNDEFLRSPWNAVVTVGLRIYHKVAKEDKDKEMVRLRVVRPNPHVKKTGHENAKDAPREKDNGQGNSHRGSREDSEGEEQGVDMEKGLDVDDSSKDATLIGDHERRKKSIVPNEGLRPPR